MNVTEVYPKVREIIADVLAIDQDNIQLNSRLIADLGAESIDFLDLIFQLEREFKIKIPRGQIEKNARGGLSDGEFENNGVISEQGIQVLRNYLSEVPAEYFKPNLKVSEIPMLFTVETFCKLIISATQEQSETVTAA